MSAQAHPGDGSHPLAAGRRGFSTTTVRTAAREHRWRQLLTWALGVAWLVDAALQ